MPNKITLINSLTPLFLLEKFSLILHFNSLEDLMEKGEDTEFIEDFINSIYTDSPKDFKEKL